MESNLFNQVEEYLREEERLTRMEEDLISSLEKNIVQVKYELQMIEISKAGKSTDIGKTFKVYYPVLKCPKTFTKENETFYKSEHIDIVFHDYTLRDANGRSLRINEKASLYHELAQEEAGLLICNNYITGDVEYTIGIGNTHKYTYHRKFNDDIVEQGKNELFVLKDNFFDNENTQNENAFRRFLDTIGSTSSITLAELINPCNSEKEIQLTSTISAKILIKKKPKKGEIWIKNSKLGIKINTWRMSQIVIIVQAYFAFNIKLEKQIYHLWQVKNEEVFRNGMSFEEAMKLIKPENGE